MCISWRNILTLQKRLSILWAIPNRKYFPSGQGTTATTMTYILLAFCLFVSEVYLHRFMEIHGIVLRLVPSSTQFPAAVTSYITILQYQNQEMTLAQSRYIVLCHFITCRFVCLQPPRYGIISSINYSNYSINYSFIVIPPLPPLLFPNPFQPLIFSPYL